MIGSSNNQKEMSFERLEREWNKKMFTMPDILMGTTPASSVTAIQAFQAAKELTKIFLKRRDATVFISGSNPPYNDLQDSSDWN